MGEIPPFEIEKTVVTAKSRLLSATYTLELPQPPVFMVEKPYVPDSDWWKQFFLSEIVLAMREHDGYEVAERIRHWDRRNYDNPTLRVRTTDGIILWERVNGREDSLSYRAQGQS